MVQALLTYSDLAQRLQISASEARVLANDLRLPRYVLPEGRTVVLCDLVELRGNMMLLEREPARHGKARQSRKGGASTDCLGHSHRGMRRYTKAKLIHSSPYGRLRAAQPVRYGANRFALLQHLSEDRLVAV